MKRYSVEVTYRIFVNAESSKQAVGKFAEAISKADFKTLTIKNIETEELPF